MGESIASLLPHIRIDLPAEIWRHRFSIDTDNEDFSIL
jgi:hypothetical protein